MTSSVVNTSSGPQIMKAQEEEYERHLQNILAEEEERKRLLVIVLAVYQRIEGVLYYRRKNV